MGGLMSMLTAVIWSATVWAAEPERFKDCGDCPELIVLPAGRFVMGTLDQRPEFGPPVDIAITRRFALAVTETTFDQYQACVAAGGCRGGQDDHGWGRGDRPVINVSWADANAYAAWLSARTGFTYRLPSEAEWEYAARAGTVTAYPWGDMIGVGHANCRGCGAGEWGGSESAPVGQFPANAFGFSDLLGNISEWVADCWNDRHDSRRTGQAPLVLPEEACQRRVTRGGDWYYIPALATTSARMGNFSVLASYTIGFRVAREIPATK